LYLYLSCFILYLFLRMYYVVIFVIYLFLYFVRRVLFVGSKVCPTNS